MVNFHKLLHYQEGLDAQWSAQPVPSAAGRSLCKVYHPRGHLPRAARVIPTSTPFCKAPLMEPGGACPALPGVTHAHVRHSISEMGCRECAREAGEGTSRLS